MERNVKHIKKHRLLCRGNTASVMYSEFSLETNILVETEKNINNGFTKK